MAIPGCKSFFRKVLVFAALAWMVGCFGTETTNPKGGLAGRMVDEEGDPMGGVTVNAILADKVPMDNNVPLGKAMSKVSAVNTIAVTNTRGFYRFDSLPQGRYNLVGETDRGVLVVMIPNVEHRSGEPDRNLGTDTLRSPGQVSGRILVDGVGKEGVFCFLPGTGFLAVSDETGAYLIRGVPQGVYEVGFSFPGAEPLMDSGIAVAAGGTSALPERELISDTAALPPAPGPLQTVYDSLLGVVTLSWSAPATPGFLGYEVYRLDSAVSPPQRILLGRTSGTRFLDTLFRNLEDTVPVAPFYQVRSVDGAGIPSRDYSTSRSIFCVPPSVSGTLLSIEVKAPRGDNVQVGDTVRLIARYYNRRHSHARIAWVERGLGNILWEKTENLKSKGSDTLIRIWTEPLSYRISFEALDSSGNAWMDSVQVDVTGNSQPMARAGRDALIRAGVPTLLTGRGEGGRDTIVQYSWDFDSDGVYDYISAVSGDVTRTFGAGETRTPIFRVRDGSGGTAYDTLNFTVGNANPGAYIASDLVFRAADGPYTISGQVVIEERSEVTVMPGTEIRLTPGSGFYVRGILKCVGTAEDSIRFSPSAMDTNGIGGGIHFAGGPASLTSDSTHLSGSRLRYVSFVNTPGVRIQGTVVTVEDCTFRNVAFGGFPGASSQAAVHLDFESGIPKALSEGTEIREGDWICRRNRFFGNGSGLAGVFPTSISNKLKAYVHGNETDGAGIRITSPWKSMSVVSIDGNVIRVPKGSISFAAFTIGGAANCIFRNNLVESAMDPVDSAEVTGLLVQEMTQAEIAHNEFRRCGKILREEGLMGRFHSNIADTGAFDLRGEFGFQADSNAFGPQVRLDGIRTLEPRDFRYNYWSTLDSNVVRARMPGTEGGTFPLFAETDPVLTVPPPEAGLLGR